MYTALGLTPLILIIGGGLSYTAGMIFFGWKRIKHHHAIFHVFVLGGSILHYIVIAGYVCPLGRRVLPVTFDATITLRSAHAALAGQSGPTTLSLCPSSRSSTRSINRR